MDVMPQVEGHCLVIPKSASLNLLDADPKVLAHLMATTQKVAKAAAKSFNADGVQIRQYNGEAAGQTVFHLHVHVLPIQEGEPIKPHTGKMAENSLLAWQAALIKAAL
jgi:histidine triad (HIT) family protein